jgi:hypothetical protein
VYARGGDEAIGHGSRWRSQFRVSWPSIAGLDRPPLSPVLGIDETGVSSGKAWKTRACEVCRLPGRTQGRQALRGWTLIGPRPEEPPDEAGWLPMKLF